jgi:hypothetical protein
MTVGAFLKSPSLFQRCFSAGIGRDPGWVRIGGIGKNVMQELRNEQRRSRIDSGMTVGAFLGPIPRITLYFFKKIFEINSKFKIILAETARLPPFKHESKWLNASIRAA